MCVAMQLLRGLGFRGNRFTKTVAKGWQHYCRFLDKYTWKAVALNTGLIYGTGDVLAQLVIERRPLKRYDQWRTLRFVGTGLCVLGPAMFVWYSKLDKIVKGSMSMQTAVKKMLLDQTLFFPNFLATYIVTLAALRGDSLAEIREELAADYKSSLIVSYYIWPGVMLGNFYLIPLKHRILVMNLVSLAWSTYIGWTVEKNKALADMIHNMPEEESTVTVVSWKQPAIAPSKTAYCEETSK